MFSLNFIEARPQKGMVIMNINAIIQGWVSKAQSKIAVEHLSAQAKQLCKLELAAKAIDNYEAAHNYQVMWADTVAQKWAIQEAWDYTLTEPTWFDRCLAWFFNNID